MYKYLFIHTYKCQILHREKQLPALIKFMFTTRYIVHNNNINNNNTTDYLAMVVDLKNKLLLIPEDTFSTNIIIFRIFSMQRH